MGKKAASKDRRALYTVLVVVAGLAVLVVLGVLIDPFSVETAEMRPPPAEQRHAYQMPRVRFTVTDRAGRPRHGAVKVQFELERAEDIDTIRRQQQKIVVAMYDELGRMTIDEIRSRDAIPAVKTMLRKAAEGRGRRGMVKAVLINELLIQ